MQGSEWLVPQVALLHTWAGEDQCRVNPLQRYYLSHTLYYYYYHHHIYLLFKYGGNAGI